MAYCNHDYVVTSMQASGDGVNGLLCYYTIECAKCGNERRGKRGEIPKARF